MEKLNRHAFCLMLFCNICECYCFPPTGQGGALVDRGDNTYGGKWVINPSGGLISKGHPLGATGDNIFRFEKFLFFLSKLYFRP